MLFGDHSLFIPSWRCIILFYTLSSLSAEAPAGKKYVFLFFFKHPMPQTPVYPQPLFHICSSLTNTLLCLVYLFGILCTVRGGCLWFGTAWWYGYMLGGVGVVVVRHRFRSYSAVSYFNLPFSVFVVFPIPIVSFHFFCMMATLQIACAEWKLPTGSQWTFRCIKIVCRRNAYLGVEILCFSNEIYILASK